MQRPTRLWTQTRDLLGSTALAALLATPGWAGRTAEPVQDVTTFTGCN